MGSAEPLRGRSWPTAVDLFCGGGGLTTGLRLAKFRVLGAVDSDPLAIKTFRSNHRGVKVWESPIERLPVAEVRRTLGIEKGDLDLLAGCPPCEGFSSLRTLNGNRRVRDSRNNLIFEFMRFVRGLRPKAILLENVPALATNSRIDRVLRELSSLGYWGLVDILDAARYGVPQRRRRMILVAGRLAPVEFAPELDGTRTVRDAIGSLERPSRSTDPLHSIAESRSDRIKTLIKQIPKNGGSRADLGRRKQLECHKHCDGFKDIYGRMAWDDVAPTITSGCVNPSKGRFLHPTQNRTITLREAALLQTFPPHYSFSLDEGKFAAARLIGNALPPEFVRRHAAQMHKYLSENV